MANRNVGKPKSSGISYDDRKLEVLTTAARLFNARGYHPKARMRCCSR
jgi:hypothetical protein